MIGASGPIRSNREYLMRGIMGLDRRTATLKMLSINE